MKDTTKDECKGAMVLPLKDGTAKDDTNVTKVDIHEPAQRDSPDADPSKEKDLLRIELTEGLMHKKPKKSSLACIVRLVYF
jgi:hypothetical protein